MAVSPKFAKGTYSWGMCDICGIRSRLLELTGTTVFGRLTGLKSCRTCWDPDHPQNFLPEAVRVDPQALQNARPDTGLWQSRQLRPPGNWINGRPPSLEIQETAQLALESERLHQQVLSRREEEAQRTRQRSF